MHNTLIERLLDNIESACCLDDMRFQGVYIICNFNDLFSKSVVYVGISDNIYNRLVSHEHFNKSMHNISFIKTGNMPRNKLEKIERILIRHFEPLKNKKMFSPNTEYCNRVLD